MRKIIAGFFISLDGVVEAPDQWHFPYADAELEQAVQSQTDTTDAMLFGRRTFEDFAGYWPTVGDSTPFAKYINNAQKYVVSSSLDAPEWKNSTVIKASEIATLKEQPGRDLGMTGSPTLVRWLLANDLLDQLNLLVHPISVGKGLRLFEEGVRVPLELLDVKTHSNGVLFLQYGPVRK